MRYYNVSETANLLGVHPQTVRRWEVEGVLIPDHKTPRGHRRYSEEQLKSFIGMKENKTIVNIKGTDISADDISALSDIQLDALYKSVKKERRSRK